MHAKTKTASLSTAPQKSLRRYIYPFVVVMIVFLWLVFMTFSNRWALFSEFRGLSITMLFGSFVAGATPQGGAAVAFPVFTKVFQIPSPDARTFGLMIQSVGMTVASLTILLRGVKVLPLVILWTTIGGIIGLILGTFYIRIPPPLPKVLFTLLLSIFAVALVISRWIIKRKPYDDMPVWNIKHALVMLIIGTIGGIFAAYTGAGADALAFVALTLAYGIDEKVSTPTTIIIMALNSVAGFALHGLIVQDIGVAWNYWLVSVPVVILGAPLGSWVLSKISRDTLIKSILGLIFIEAVSTLLLIPFTGVMINIVLVTILVTTVIFYAMLYYREHHLWRVFTSE